MFNRRSRVNRVNCYPPHDWACIEAVSSTIGCDFIRPPHDPPIRELNKFLSFQNTTYGA